MQRLQNIIDDIVPQINKKRQKNIPLRNQVVFQHNHLIEANYKLSLQEKRTILWLISTIKRNDEDFKDHTLQIEEFIKIADLSGESSYSQVKKITSKLVGKVLKIRNLDLRQEIQVAWLSSAVYMENEGRVALRFDPYMKPFLLKLQESFTAIKLSDLMQFSSVYAIRIYELLKQYETISERVVKILDIRDHCGISSEKLDKYSQFKERVLIIAQKEINSKSDIHFEFEELKTGRKITSIKFIVQKNKFYRGVDNSSKVNTTTTNSNYHTDRIKEAEGIIIRGLTSLKFTYPSIKKLLNDHQDNLSTLVNALSCVEIQIERGNAKNPKAMFKTAVEQKWHPDHFSTKNK